MAWRSYTNPQERLLACLPYLLPMVVSLVFGVFVFQQFPQLTFLLRLLEPIMPLAQGIPGLVIFFMLYALVVRNSQISHFIRFNTMQALLVDLGLSIMSFLFSLFNIAANALLTNPAGFLLVSTLASTLFLGTLIIVFYSWVMIVQGKYPEVPVISEAAQYHVGY
ncbi:MAG: Tic20 family protein [Pseudanabaenaceae cyanobacterium]